MDIELVTPPDEAKVLELVTVAQVKANERVTHTAHDLTLFPDSIKQAYAFLDGRGAWLNRSILTQTWRLWLPRLCNEIELPLGPVQSVTSVQYFDRAAAQQTLAADQYEVQPGEFVATLSKAVGATYPSTHGRKRAVSITYEAGFGDPDSIQFPLKARLQKAIILLASHFYRNPAATYAEPRTIAVNRTVQFGLEDAIGMLKVPNDHS